MTDEKQLPYLVRLVDDDSALVRERVEQELLSFGPNLKTRLLELDPSLIASHRTALDRLVAHYDATVLQRRWPVWLSLVDEYGRLEAALSDLAVFQGGLAHGSLTLAACLDELAAAYRAQHPRGRETTLSDFLFKEKRLRGVERDALDPQSSNTVHVIRGGKGLPITLCCIYMLVGRRVGLAVEGCSLPGYFMARIFHRRQWYLVDCFQGGRRVPQKDIFRLSPHNASLKEIVSRQADSTAIVKRVLANLIRAYQHTGQEARMHLMMELFHKLEKRRSAASEEGGPATRPLFAPGQKIFHKQYGYRGLVVAMDTRCKAGDEWYFRNQTQPERRQPWYHVLVHGSDQATYAAESNLEPEESAEGIEHPLIEYFFEKRNGQYIRNTNPWPR